MGDVLRTTCLLPALKRLYPASHITWITKKNAADLLATNVYVDQVLSIESNYIEILLVQEFDLAIGPDTDFLSASIMTLIKSAEKKGFVADRRGGVLSLNEAARRWLHMGMDDDAKRRNRYTYGKWLYDICELDYPVERPIFAPTANSRAQVRSGFRSHAPWAKRWFCFNTGASGRWREKRWKLGHYRDLAFLISKGQPDAAIALVGGPEEIEFNRELLASGAPLFDAGTGLSIEHFAGVVAESDCLITPDSLGYHIGCAVGTPSICLVGPTSPWELDLFSVNIVLHADVDCIACYRRESEFEQTCMDVLTPERVLEYLPELGSSALQVSGLYAVPTCNVIRQAVPTPLTKVTRLATPVSGQAGT